MRSQMDPAVTLGLREDLRLKFSESQVTAGRRGCDRRSPAVNRGLIGLIADCLLYHYH